MPDIRDSLLSGSTGSLEDLGPVESQAVFTQPLPVSCQGEALTARSQPDGGISVNFQVLLDQAELGPDALPAAEATLHKSPRQKWDTSLQAQPKSNL